MLGEICLTNMFLLTPAVFFRPGPLPFWTEFTDSAAGANTGPLRSSMVLALVTA
jgi:hypothetical protein